MSGWSGRRSGRPGRRGASPAGSKPACFERIHGRRFEIQRVPAEALLAQQEAATDPMAQSFAGLMRCYANGDPIDMRATLRSFPVTLTSVDEHAAATARAMAVPA